MADLVVSQIKIKPYENFCVGLKSKETQNQDFLDRIYIHNRKRKI